MKYISLAGDNDEKKDLLAVSTEDGRVIFYSTSVLQDAEEGDDSTIPHATPVAQVGGKQTAMELFVSGRLMESLWFLQRSRRIQFAKLASS
jgi:hypothetical protein